MNKDIVISKELINHVINIFLNIAGSALLAFGICAFVEPFNLIAGGATGISLIVHRLTGLNVSVVAMAINIIVLPVGYFFGNKKLVIGSLLSSICYPVALGIFEQVPAITTIADSSIMATLCAGICCGAGVGLVMKSGGSTGGIDIPVILMAKIFHLPVGRMMNITDSVIMCAQIPLSGLTNIVYGLMFTYIMSHTLDKILTFGEERMKITVISEKYHDIRWGLLDNDFGCTVIQAEGGYTKTPLLKIESVMRSGSYRQALQIIESIDPVAFVTVEKVMDVRGPGYTIARESLERSWEK